MPAVWRGGAWLRWRAVRERIPTNTIKQPVNTIKSMLEPKQRTYRVGGHETVEFAVIVQGGARALEAGTVAVRNVSDTHTHTHTHTPKHRGVAG